MSFSDIIYRVEGDKKTLTLLNYSGHENVLEDMKDHFEVQNVSVELEETDSGMPTNVAILHDKEDFLAAGDIKQLENAVTFEQGFLEADDFYDLEYPEILRHTEDTTFSSYNKRKMIIASREIEEVAWKRGEGRLYSCFQKLSILKEQWDLYTRIGERGVGVNAYGIPDWEPPETDMINVHGAQNGEIEDNWFVVYDGAGDDGKKRALLAEQREDDWYGFWTYDAEIVDEITEYINSKW